MFTQEDFKENSTRLSVIIMSQIGNPPLTSFLSLSDGHQMKFNRLLNSYIRTLGTNWSETITSDFDTIVHEDILNDKFKPEMSYYIRELSTVRQLVLSDEQKAFFETQPDELAKIKV